MDEIVVSVIIPTYKRAEQLTMAIESVLNQTLEEIEVIVVDDNNPDTEFRAVTEKIMSAYKNNSKVVYLKHEKNKNGAAARNTGIKHSRGNYISFLDDDDLYYPTKLEKEVKFLEKNLEYDAVYCGRVQNGRIIYGKLHGDLSKEILLETFTPTTPALMFRRKVMEEINGFNVNFRRHQDYEMLLRFFKKYKMGAIEEPLVEIGINDGSNELHGDALEKTKESYLKIFSGEIESIDKRNPGFKKKVYLKTYRFIFFDHLSQKKIKKALKFYIKGCKLSLLAFQIEVFKYALSYIQIKINRKKIKNMPHV